MTRVVDHPGFARLLVGDGREETALDLGADARLFPVEERSGLRVLAGEELAVDKLLALFGRAEARDFVDLWAVADRYGLDRLFALAVEKDRGFDPNVLAEMLTRIDRLPRAEFPVDDSKYEQLQSAVRHWRERAMSYARERAKTRDLDRGHGLGFGR